MLNTDTKSKEKGLSKSLLELTFPGKLYGFRCCTGLTAHDKIIQ